MRTGNLPALTLSKLIGAGALVLGLVPSLVPAQPGAVPSRATVGSPAKAPLLAWHAVPVQAPRLEPASSGSAGMLGYLLSNGNMTCLSRSDCVVAGYLQDLDVAPETYQGVIWRWDGSAWSVQSTGLSGDIGLVGTACAAATDCWAVGARFEGAHLDQLVGLVDHFNGTGWSPSVLPGADGVALNGVSCVSASNCVAVGNQETSSDKAHALAYRWDGERWSPLTAVSPAGALWTVLDSVQCFTATNCLAVGDADDSPKGSGYFFGERFNGTSWSLFTMPNKTKFNMGTQTDVTLSCSQAQSCLVVGSALGYTNGEMGADFPFGVSYASHGGSWAPVAVPKGSGQLNYFFENGSCTAGAGCWGALGVPGIVGGGLTSDIAVAHWDGSSFQLFAASALGYLSSIGCLPATTGTWCVGLGEAPTRWVGKGSARRPTNAALAGGYFVVKH